MSLVSSTQKEKKFKSFLDSLDKEGYNSFNRNDKELQSLVDWIIDNNFANSHYVKQIGTTTITIKKVN